MPERVSIRVPHGELVALRQAVRRVRASYGPLFAVWKSLPEIQRQRILAGSPILASLLEGVV